MSSSLESELLIADTFWQAFAKREPVIKQLLYNRTYDDYQNARDIIDMIIDISNLENQIQILFGVDIRNGMSLCERRNHIELIITPLYQRKNKKLIIALFNTHKKYLPAYWNVIKYKIWQPNNINSITVTDTDGGSIEILKHDFQFVPIVDKDSQKLNILLFIKNSVAKHLIKKEKYEIGETVRDIWIPQSIGVYSILESVIGEYHLLNTLDKMEIYLESEEIDVTDRRPIEKMADVINMIANNPMSGISTCARCNYSNKQVILKSCICKNVYYCDAICQRAHRQLHKLKCESSK